MSKRSLSVNLPRRVIAYYVMFSLLGIIGLGCGMIYLSHLDAARHQQTQLDRVVEKAQSSCLLAYSCKGSAGLQDCISRLSGNGLVNDCSVVDIDGTYLAHPDPDQVGTVHVEPPGIEIQHETYAELRCHGTEGVQRFLNVKLVNKNQPLGTLRIQLAGDNFRGHAGWSASRMPWLLIPALLLIGMGGLFIHRMVWPVASVHEQLCHLASVATVDDVELELIPTRDAMSLGWNKLVDQIQRTPSTLQTRVSQKLEARRNGNEVALLDSLTDGFAHTDAEGHILFVNSAMTALLGMERTDIDHEAMIQQCLALEEHLVESDHAAELFDPEACNRPAVAEIRRRFQNSERILRVARQPIRDFENPSRSGDFRPGQAWSVRDVTQQRLADKARDDFLDSATHELRTPLANIKAYAETLQLNEMIDVEQQKEFCNVINSEATRLARFIDELLDVSSIEAGSLVIQCQKVETRRLLDETVVKIRPLMEQKQINFSVDFSEKLPELSLDKDKFHTCLINLLGNAAKYTPEQGTVVFRARQMDSRFVIDIEDNGIGIGENELPRIFEKFYRANDERVHDQTGTGLGLAFAREVVQLHGGSLTAQSQLNDGSIFTISIPVA